MLVSDWTPAAVVFDCDGLLVDTESCWTVAETEIFARRGLSFGIAQKALFLGISVTAEAREMARIFGPGSNPHELEVELLELAAVAIGENARPMPGARSFVERVGRMLPVAVASNSPRRLLDLALERGGFARSFRVSIAGDEVGAPKPAPDIYLEACRRLEVLPERALALEDSMTGVRSAKAAGLRVGCIPTLKELAYPAEHVFASLEDAGLLDWLGKWAQELRPPK